jgi:hypothetical protein
MNSRGRYSVRVEGARYGASFSTALAITIFVHRPITRSCGRSSFMGRVELVVRDLLRPVSGVDVPTTDRGGADRRYGLSRAIRASASGGSHNLVDTTRFADPDWLGGEPTGDGQRFRYCRLYHSATTTSAASKSTPRPFAAPSATIKIVGAAATAAMAPRTAAKAAKNKLIPCSVRAACPAGVPEKNIELFR